MLVLQECVWSAGGMILIKENLSTRSKNLSQCHLVYLKFHMDRHYIETYVLL